MKTICKETNFATIAAVCGINKIEIKEESLKLLSNWQNIAQLAQKQTQSFSQNARQTVSQSVRLTHNYL